MKHHDPYGPDYYRDQFLEKGNRFMEKIAKAKFSEATWLNPLMGNGFVSVLDVGCGVGNWLSAFRGNSIGVEISRTAVKICTEKGHDVRHFDGINLPFPKESFDLIICHHVLEHAEDPVALLREMKRVLTKDGKIALTVPHCRLKHQDGTHLWVFNESGFGKMLREVPLFFSLKKPYWKFFRGIGRLPFSMALPISRAYAKVGKVEEIEAVCWK